MLEPRAVLIREMTREEKCLSVNTATAICEQAVTLVRDREKVLPINTVTSKKILIVAMVPKSRKGGDGGLEVLKNFQKILKEKGFDTDFQHELMYETQGWQETVCNQYDKIIFVAVRTPHAPFGPLQFWDDQARTAWAINSMQKK